MRIFQCVTSLLVISLLSVNAFGWGAPKILEESERSKTYEFSTKLDKKKGFSKLTIWAAKTFSDSNESIKMKDAEAGVLVAKGNLGCEAMKMGNGFGKNQRVELVVEATVEDKKAEVKASEIVGRSDGSYDDAARPSTKDELAAALKECIDPFVEKIKKELN